MEEGGKKKMYILEYVFKKQNINTISAQIEFSLQRKLLGSSLTIQTINIV